MVKVVPKFVIAFVTIVVSVFPAVEIGFFAYETYDAYSTDARSERNTAEALLLFQTELQDVDLYGELDEEVVSEARAYWVAARDAYLRGESELAQQALHVAQQRLHLKDVTILDSAGNPIDLTHLLPPEMRAPAYVDLLPPCEQTDIGYGCQQQECTSTGIEGVNEREICEIQICRQQVDGVRCDVGQPLPPNMSHCADLQVTSDGQWCQITECYDYDNETTCDSQACIVWNDDGRDGFCDYFEQEYELMSDQTECFGDCVDVADGSAGGYPVSYAKLRDVSANLAEVTRGHADAPTFPILLTVIPGLIAAGGWAWFISNRKG